MFSLLSKLDVFGILNF